MQRFRLAELLRIGTRDLLGLSDLFQTTRELSLLAETILQFCVEMVFKRLTEQLGEPRSASQEPVTLAAIGMGKLAGRELNYSSDLDVQFVYSAEGKTTRGIANTEFFERLARTLVRELKRPILGGAIYELDLRLRPYGRGGPMALPLEAYARLLRGEGRVLGATGAPAGATCSGRSGAGRALRSTGRILRLLGAAYGRGGRTDLSRPLSQGGQSGAGRAIGSTTSSRDTAGW
ncbi:MAG: hypothetical protein KatS3mg115_0270 [Candidatus Poribacteria bacterium]|nr:MAG: hypothetical protein KatS3mg115_0270 [Candidatus Poribacteria bacterium]